MATKAKLNVQSFPRPPLLEQISRRILVKYQNHVIAETDKSFWALETHHPPSNCSLISFIFFVDLEKLTTFLALPLPYH